MLRNTNNHLTFNRKNAIKILFCKFLAVFFALFIFHLIMFSAMAFLIIHFMLEPPQNAIHVFMEFYLKIQNDPVNAVLLTALKFSLFGAFAISLLIKKEME